MSPAAPRLRRIWNPALLAVAGAVLAVVVTQCRPVPDDLLGVRQSARSFRGAGDCISACAHAFNDSIRVESNLHVDNVHACASDSVCLALESIRHDHAVARIQTGRAACQNNCHHQGGGGGGR